MVCNRRKDYVIFGLITSLPTAKVHTAIADYIHAIGVIEIYLTKIDRGVNCSRYTRKGRQNAVLFVCCKSVYSAFLIFTGKLLQKIQNYSILLLRITKKMAQIK